MSAPTVHGEDRLDQAGTKLTEVLDERHAVVGRAQLRFGGAAQLHVRSVSAAAPVWSPVAGPPFLAVAVAVDRLRRRGNSRVGLGRRAHGGIGLEVVDGLGDRRGLRGGLGGHGRLRLGGRLGLGLGGDGAVVGRLRLGVRGQPGAARRVGVTAHEAALHGVHGVAHLAHRLVQGVTDLRLEALAHAAHLAVDPADLADGIRQLVRPQDDEGYEQNDHQLATRHVEHSAEST